MSYSFKDPYWCEKPLSRQKAIQLLFDWDYPMVWTFAGYGTEFARARIDCFGHTDFDLRLNALMQHVCNEIDIESGIEAFLELLVKPLTSEEKKICGDVGFGAIHEFFGPLSARAPEQAIRTCHDFFLKQRELLLAEKEITFSFRKPAPPKKWWQFSYTDTIEVTETRKYCAGTQFKDLFCSIPFNEWNSIAISTMKLKLENEEILSHIEQLHLDAIAALVSKMNETVKQYHKVVELIFKSGLCRQLC